MIRRPAGVPAPVAPTPAPGSTPVALATAPPVPALPPPRARSISTCGSRWARSWDPRAAARRGTARRDAHHLTRRPAERRRTLQTVNGTYQAYGQKLGIDRGVLTFVGPIENPRLDIEATRPNLDVRVGVNVAGTALNPRIRLFSEPDMSDIDKLSWLVLGRASEGVGRNDTALLQRATLALLSGEGPGVTDRLTQAIGLDEISVRQSPRATSRRRSSAGQADLEELVHRLRARPQRHTGSWQLISARAASRYAPRPAATTRST